MSTINQPPYTAEHMSQAIYQCLCDSQIREQCYGEDAEGNSTEIQWSASHESWQIIQHFTNGQMSVSYDHFSERSFQHWDPVLLYDLCDNLDLLDDLQEQLEASS